MKTESKQIGLEPSKRDKKKDQRDQSEGKAKSGLYLVRHAISNMNRRMFGG